MQVLTQIWSTKDVVPPRAAARGGHEHIIKLLLKKGANVNATSEQGTALDIMKERGHVGVTRLLDRANALEL